MSSVLNGAKSSWEIPHTCTSAIGRGYWPSDAAESTNGELLALISLGDEMSSHANILHGGINTTIVDEVGGGLASRANPDSFMAFNFNATYAKL